MLNEIFNNLLNEDGDYPSLESFRENAGGPASYIDNVLGTIKNMQRFFNDELRSDLTTIMSLTENPSRLKKNEESKKQLKKLLHKYRNAHTNYKKQNMEAMISTVTVALKNMIPLEEAFKLAGKLYSEIE